MDAHPSCSTLQTEQQDRASDIRGQIGDCARKLDKESVLLEQEGREDELPVEHRSRLRKPRNDQETQLLEAGARADSEIEFANKRKPPPGTHCKIKSSLRHLMNREALESIC